MSAPLLDVHDLQKHFTVGSRFTAGGISTVKAVNGVSFSIAAGEVLALVGESGCGKSTVGRTLTGLEAASGGSALFNGTNLVGLSNARMRPLRRDIQMIFQDPFASLNPRLTIEQTLAEPLHIHGLATRRRDAQALIAAMLEKVGLGADAISRYPHEFSGGQRQRIGIARVMILEPQLIIADEAVSALDVSIQAQVLNLLKALQRDSGVAMLFISHDLGVVRHISNTVAVMYLGRIVEIAPTRTLFENPAHPYTRLLLDSIPRPDPARRRHVPDIVGEPASASAIPSGCAFHSRCAYATDRCVRERPELSALSPGHASACHYSRTLFQEAT
jgi:peptide/nickel transport system ATP-binding protein/oligopeptide transport system ATP-binding protein